MNNRTKHIIVIGGGITGLSAAYTLLHTKKKESIKVTIIEREHRLGGKINTANVTGNVIERGPDSFLAHKDAMIHLCEKLGLADRFAGTGPTANKAFLVSNQALTPFPRDTFMGIPYHKEAIEATNVLSEQGKSRALEDFFTPNEAPEGDESLGHFLSRRLGTEMMERLAEPILAGIYAGHAAQLSLLATYPEFRDLERKYGSFLQGLQTLMTSSKRTAKTSIDADLSSNARSTSVFLTIQNGLQTIVKALAEAIGKDNIHLGTRVRQIVTPEDTELSATRIHPYTIYLSDNSSVEADAILLATPAFAAAQILQDHDLQMELAGIPYTSVATVTLLFSSDQLDVKQYEGSGFIVPSTEPYTITACTFVSAKWPQNIHHGTVVLRCFIGRAGQDKIVLANDDEIIARVREDLKSLLHIEAKPGRVLIKRWPHAMPQYQVGHLDRVARIRQLLALRFPGIFVAGAGYEGVGLPDCINQGEQAATQILDYLQAQSPHYALVTKRSKG